MKNLIIDKIPTDRDFIPLFSGEEICEAGHSFGPFVRDYYLIHFCLSGKGVLIDKYGEHKICAGELFIIREGETTTYKADQEDPWHYLWIATVGRRAEELEEYPSVVGCDLEFFNRIKATVDKNETHPDIYCAFLCELLYLGAERKNGENADKISKVKRYVKYNYMLDINVESISRLFGFERSYLYRLFKKRYGIGVKDYVIKVRMEKAKQLLAGSGSVRSVAELVGYSDEFSFSKAFKLYSGVSPTAYRKAAVKSAACVKEVIT